MDKKQLIEELRHLNKWLLKAELMIPMEKHDYTEVSETKRVSLALTRAADMLESFIELKSFG